MNIEIYINKYVVFYDNFYKLIIRYFIMVEFYCQNCGRELTKEGGDVTTTGRIYCHGYKKDGESRCMDHEMILMFKGKIKPQKFTTNYTPSNEVQKLIDKGELKEFGQLEDSVGN